MILEYVPFGLNAFEEGGDGGTTVRSRASSSSLTPKVEPRSRSKPEQWNSEQIGDFVRKLGFMDTEREAGEKIKHFRHISSVSAILYHEYYMYVFHMCTHVTCISTTSRLYIYRIGSVFVGVSNISRIFTRVQTFISLQGKA